MFDRTTKRVKAKQWWSTLVKKSVKLSKTKMNSNILIQKNYTFISLLDGFVILLSSVLISPDGMSLRHCSIILNDWRIS